MDAKLKNDTGADSNELLKNSRFVHLFKKDNTYCMFHSLTLRKVYGGDILQKLYEAFSSPRYRTEILNMLSTTYPRDILNRVIMNIKEKGMIITDNETDLKIYIKLLKYGMSLYQTENMYFIPTTECNFRCKYCFVEDENKTFIPVHMTQDIARKGLEIFAKLTENSDNINITFYGGEPLLNADIVYFSMHYVRTLEKEGAFKKPVELTLLTNGALVDNRTIEAVLETHTNVSVSIDGPEYLHNEARKDIMGSNTFNEVLAGYRKFQKAGITPGVSCTLNKFNIGHIEEITNFIVEELKPLGVGFNPLIPRINAENPLDYPYEYSASQLIAAFKILRKKGIYEDRVMRYVKTYIGDGFHFKDCMGVGGQIVLTPEGRIGPCLAFLGLDEYYPLNVNDLHSQLPSISSEYIYKNTFFNEWRYRFPLNMKQCINCFAIAVCGGGCPYISLVNHGSIWEIDERICTQAKQILEWMLWDTYDHMIDASKKNGGYGTGVNI